MFKYDHQCAKMVIVLKKNRWEGGTAYLYGPDGRTLLEVPCRGKADGQRAKKATNPERRSIYKYGDTPCGDYEPTTCVRLPEEYEGKLGKYWFALNGEFGDAYVARFLGHRTGLGGHGGKGEELRATYGCIRFKDSDMERIAHVCKNQTFRVTIMEIDDD